MAALAPTPTATMTQNAASFVWCSAAKRNRQYSPMYNRDCSPLTHMVMSCGVCVCWAADKKKTYEIDGVDERW